MEYQNSKSKFDGKSWTLLPVYRYSVSTAVWELALPYLLGEFASCKEASSMVPSCSCGNSWTRDFSSPGLAPLWQPYARVPVLKYRYAGHENTQNTVARCRYQVLYR